MKIKNLLAKYKYEILSPILISLFPVIFLYAQNIDLVPYNLIARTVIILLSLTIFTYLILNSLLKDKIKSSLILCVILIPLFLYGHILNSLFFLDYLKIRLTPFGKDRILSLLILTVVLIIIRKILKTKGNLKGIIKYLFFIFTFLIFINFIRIANFFVSIYPLIVTSKELPSPNIKPSGDLPDIYYIITDMHARADILEEIYNYKDNTLIPYLKKQGFFIASKSQTNYLNTSLSLSSSLNLDYAENIFKDHPKSYTNYSVTKRVIDKNRTALELKKYGYTYVSFNSGASITETNSYADVFYDYDSGLNRFEQLFLNSTIFSKFLGNLKFDLNNYDRHRIISIFEGLKNISKNPKPTFTFAHIVSPHPPFIFGPNGESVGAEKRFSFKDALDDSSQTKEEYKIGYINQLTFIDKKIVETVDAILSNSKKKPIIIIQGDHGPSSEIDWNNINNLSGINKIINPKSEISVKERSSILNVYYFPDNGDKMLYESISPVNTFRALLKYYFNYPIELLKDKTIVDK